MWPERVTTRESEGRPGGAGGEGDGGGAGGAGGSWGGGGGGWPGGGWLGGVGGVGGGVCGSGMPGGVEGGGAGNGGMAGCLRFSASTTSRSFVIEPAASLPGASGGSNGEGGLGGSCGGGGRGGGRAGGAGGLNKARQQPVQSQSSSLDVSSQVKESFNAAHDSLRMHRWSHGSSGSVLAAACRLQSSRPTTTTADAGAKGVG